MLSVVADPRYVISTILLLFHTNFQIQHMADSVTAQLDALELNSQNVQQVAELANDIQQRVQTYNQVESGRSSPTPALPSFDISPVSYRDCSEDEDNAPAGRRTCLARGLMRAESAARGIIEPANIPDCTFEVDCDCLACVEGNYAAIISKRSYHLKHLQRPQ